MDLVEPDTPLPSWFTEEDLATYGALYEKSGFQNALQVPYRYYQLFFITFFVKSNFLSQNYKQGCILVMMCWFCLYL